jgi:hypothetical protein
MHRRYIEPTHPDSLAFHEAFADLVALFQHFTFPDVLRHQIAKTRGDLKQKNLLAELAQEFGQALGNHGALRSALRDEPDPAAVSETMEPHARGSILVAAVFDAFATIYSARASKVIRLATAGSGDMVDFEYIVFIGEREIIRKFIDRGTDLVTGYPIAKGLIRLTRLFLGIYKSNIQKHPELQFQANMALRHFCGEANLPGVSLLMWLGANPRAKVPCMLPCQVHAAALNIRGKWPFATEPCQRTLNSSWILFGGVNSSRFRIRSEPANARA